MSKADELEDLYEQYARVQVLQQVAAGRPPVRGAGPLDAPVLVLGEAPGAEEEQRGEPFVGPAGQLLQRMLREASIPWDACYRTNVLAWRPPANRTPYPFEVVASAPRVAREVAVIRPAVVIAAGATAWECVSAGAMGRFAEARGKWHQDPAGDWPVLAVFHPSAILRAKGAERQQMKAATVSALSSAMVTPVE